VESLPLYGSPKRVRAVSGGVWGQIWTAGDDIVETLYRVLVCLADEPKLRSAGGTLRGV
jgi:hypothetical protein